VPRTSYLRGLIAPPAGNMAVLRPPHKPAWGLSPAFGQRLTGGDLPHDGFLTSSTGKATGHDFREPREPGGDRQIGDYDSELQPQPVQTIEVDRIGRGSERSPENLPLRGAAPSHEEQGMPGNPAMPHSPEKSNSIASSHPSLIPGRQSPSPQEQAQASPEADKAPSASSASATAKLERLTADLTAVIRNTNPSEGKAGFSSPFAASTQGAEGRTSTKKSGVHIGTIDIRVAPPELPQRNVARRQPPTLTPVLSRGFTSSYGLRQG
jgi:hypothetical protein